MKYTIVIEQKALKFISKQPQKQKIRLLRAIHELPDGDTLKMSGKQNIYRLRVGSYRIIFTIAHDRLIISVIEAGNRGDVYK